MRNLCIFLLLSLSISSFGADAKPKAKVLKPKAKTNAKVSVVVRLLQKQWDSSKTFQANFRQVVFSKRIGTRDESKGMLYLLKPGKLRWVSETDKSIQIINGSRFTLVSRNERRNTTTVEIFENASKAVDSQILHFLSGKEKFKQNYNFKLVSEGSDVYAVRFTPKEPNRDSMIAEISKKSYLLRSLTTENADSRVRIDFSNIKTGTELKPDLFEYKVKPEDVVVRQ